MLCYAYFPRYMIKSFRRCHRLNSYIRLFSTSDDSRDGDKHSADKNAGISAGEVSGFAEAMHRFDQLDRRRRGGLRARRDTIPGSESESGMAGRPHDQLAQDTSFLSLLRHSKLMQIGDPDGRIIVGTISDIVDEDLYIDFGGKFHCVCKRPQQSEYQRGTRVKLILHDTEMTSSFLGAKKHVTLLEADGTLIGLHKNQRIIPD